MPGRRNNRLRLPPRLRSWKPLLTVAVAVLAGLLAADSKTGARTGAVNAVTAVLEDLFLLFCSDDFGDASAPPDWIEVDEDEAAPAAPPRLPPRVRPRKLRNRPSPPACWSATAGGRASRSPPSREKAATAAASPTTSPSPSA